MAKAKNRWVISDTHFGHSNSTKWLNADGSKVRPFSSVEEMDECMVERWNSVVGPSDRVYHLGDVAISRHAISVIERCNGKKILVKGNHDIFKLKDYTPYFEDVRAYVVDDDLIMSHIPLHPSQLKRFSVNIHGHTHANYMDDPRYYCACVEHIDFTPIHLDTIRAEIDKRKAKFDGEYSNDPKWKFVGFVG